MCDQEFTVCQYEWFPKRYKEKGDPDSLTIDGGKTWLPFPYKFDFRFVGRHEIGFKIPIFDDEDAEDLGDDSIKITPARFIGHREYFCNNFLTINPVIEDKITVKVNGNCTPHVATMYFEKGNFLKNDTVKIHWGDSSIKTIIFTDSTKLDSVSHRYILSGYEGVIIVEFITANGCKTKGYDSISFGYKAEIIPEGPFCKDRDISFKANVKDYVTDDLWTEDNSYGTVSWIIDGVQMGSNSFSTSKKILSTGKHVVQLISNIGGTCKDTIQETIIVQEVIANVTKASRTFYCSELGQFFDSSTLVENLKGDFIKEYLWDFGTKKYSTVDKDPFRSFVGITGEVNVSHVVISNSGCTDTTEFMVKVIGSNPYFTMTYSIGCDPVTVTFKNQSTNASSYIWEFGDITNNTHSTASKEDISFTFKEEGEYYVHLVGIDTVFNSHTGNVYYCKSTFPSKNSNIKRKVTVLASYKSGLEIEDTICLGQMAQFKSNSDIRFKQDLWDYGNGRKEIKTPGDSFDFRYSKEGKYTVTLRPSAFATNGTPYCHDSIVTKDIWVLDAQARFSKEDIGCDPIFYFKNESTPMDASFFWDFDDVGSKTNFSTETNGVHNYGVGSLTHEVCLTVVISKGCKDKYCNRIYSNYNQYFKLYNVFTPGNGDILNEEYDIEIDGEQDYELTIFNRWNQVVYKSDKDGIPGDGINWNGTLNNNGEACAAGTYYYVFKYNNCINPENKQSVSGVVTLIR